MEAWRGHYPLCPFKRGTTGVEMLHHNSIIGNIMLYQDLLETNLLQLFGHQENSEWFSIVLLWFLWSTLLIKTETNVIGKGFFLCFHGPKFFTAPLPLLQRSWIRMLCQQSSPKHWFANVKMTSYCGVTHSVYLVTMTTTCHCSLLELERGASNQAVAPGITRPLHATDPKGCKRIK